MLYRRSFEVEKRLSTALRLIRSGGYCTSQLARQLRVSVPTASRYVTALRARGHEIRAKRRGDSWSYVVVRRKPVIGRRSLTIDERDGRNA